MTHCYRCHVEITKGREQPCMICNRPICQDCWDEYGFCLVCRDGQNPYENEEAEQWHG